MKSVNVREELVNAVEGKKEEVKMEARPANDILNNTKFVQFSYASEDGFARFEAVKAANDIIKEAVRKTGGDMPTELIDAYEGLNNVMEHIKSVELDVIRVGR